MRPRTRIRRLLAGSAVVACTTLALAGTAAAEDDSQADASPGLGQIVSQLLGQDETPETSLSQEVEPTQPAEPSDEAAASDQTQPSERSAPSEGTEPSQRSEQPSEPAPEPEREQAAPAPREHRMTEAEEEAAHRRNAPPAGVPQGEYVPDFGPPPCSKAADACIDLTDYQAWLMRDGKVIYGPVQITHGRARPGERTPPGSFNVSFKDIDHESSIYNNAPMPYSVFFNGGIAFHEGSLQVPSAGCIHLSHEAAVTFFKNLQPSDVVEVYY